MLKVSVLPTEICPLAAELHQWTAGDETDLELVAQATGLMMVAVHSATDAALVALMERLRARVSKSGGSVVAFQIQADSEAASTCGARIGEPFP